jgi:hypothetical protein
LRPKTIDHLIYSRMVSCWKWPFSGRYAANSPLTCMLATHWQQSA